MVKELETIKHNWFCHKLDLDLDDNLHVPIQGNTQMGCQGTKWSNDMGGVQVWLYRQNPQLYDFGEEKPQLHSLLRMRVMYHCERG